MISLLPENCLVAHFHTNYDPSIVEKCILCRPKDLATVRKVICACFLQDYLSNDTTKLDAPIKAALQDRLLTVAERMVTKSVKEDTDDVFLLQSTDPFAEAAKELDAWVADQVAGESKTEDKRLCGPNADTVPASSRYAILECG